VVEASLDERFMTRALWHAARGRGRTTPNPMVGAVVVTPEGIVVGTGYHAAAGAPHAEVVALEAAGARARGATLYVTLEPCCHWGRTGPCVERIVAAGIARVVAAVEDPDPRVAGGGLRYLREHGVAVTVGPGRAAAVRLNAPYFTVARRGRPWVVLKVALSLDGRVAARPGVRTALTGPSAARVIHWQRAAVDAIAVGSETVRVDDPLLTPRGAYRARPLVRVVFDRFLRTPPTARLLSTLDAGPVIMVVAQSGLEAHPDRARALEAAGAQLLVTRTPDVAEALARLVPLGVHEVLVEGGVGLHRATWRAGVVDRVDAWITPVVIGPEGVPWLAADELSLAGLRDVRVEWHGSDVRVVGDVHRFD
jgi:diaminohydroxyphosphoribosylaminopyrimidine deaminase/5-amino-6-(5-phosphoribosylamino)uracil reductase